MEEAFECHKISLIVTQYTFLLEKRTQYIQLQLMSLWIICDHFIYWALMWMILFWVTLSWKIIDMEKELCVNYNSKFLEWVEELPYETNESYSTTLTTLLNVTEISCVNVIWNRLYFGCFSIVMNYSTILKLSLLVFSI